MEKSIPSAADLKLALQKLNRLKNVDKNKLKELSAVAARPNTKPEGVLFFAMQRHQIAKHTSLHRKDFRKHYGARAVREAACDERDWHSVTRVFVKEYGV